MSITKPHEYFGAFMLVSTLLGIIIYCWGFLVFRNPLANISPLYMNACKSENTSSMLMNHDRLLYCLSEIVDQEDNIIELSSYTNVKALYNRQSEELLSFCLTNTRSHNHWDRYRIQSGAWMPSRFDTIIIVLIDALRHDFILQHSDNSNNHEISKTHEIGKPEIYNNRLNILSNINTQNGSTWSCTFIADPPTTTLQRISGITSGTLSTFMEAAFNFGEYESLQDNLLLQLEIKYGTDNMYLFGDSTWVSLYPHILSPPQNWDEYQTHTDEIEFTDTTSIHRVVPYYSFHLFDLDTVDNGIKKHMFPLLKNDSFYAPVMIAHFLGVDHCGHMYGPNSRYMATKLDEMNQVIHHIINRLNEHPIYKQKNSLLAVFGDHGMTDEGDHGGTSVKEVASGLAFYAREQLSIVSAYENLLAANENSTHESVMYGWIPKELLQNEVGLIKKLYRSRVQDLFRAFIYQNVAESKDLLQKTMVSQIDFAPTICLLLGLPIPFSNVGSIIPELLWSIDPLSWFSKDGPGYIESRNTSISFAFLRVRIQNVLYQISAIRLVLQQMLIYILDLCKLKENGFDKHVVFPMLEEYSRLGILLLNQANEIENYTEQAYKNTSDIFIGFLTLAHQIALHSRKIWSSYNVIFMQCGIFILIFVLFCCLGRIFTDNDAAISYKKIFLYLFFLLFVIYISTNWMFSWPLSVFSLFVIYMAIFYTSIPHMNQLLYYSPCLIPYLLHVLGLLSSSGIVHEDRIVTFLMSTILVCNMFLNRKLYSKPRELVKGLKLLVILLFLIRLSSFTGLCREEQHPYCRYYSHRDISLIYVYHFFTPICSLSFLVLIFISSGLIIDTCIRYYHRNISFYRYHLYHHISFQCIHARWWIVWIQESMDDHMHHSPTIKSTLLAIDVLLSLVVIFLIFVYICVHWRDISRSRFKDTSSFVSVGANTMLPILYLVQRPFTGFMFIILSLGQGFLSNAYFKQNDNYLSLFHLIYMYFQSHQLLFSGGHQFTLTGIQWEAAYIGFRHNAPQIICAMFVIFNTFSSYLYTALMLFIQCHKVTRRIVITMFILYLCPLIVGAIGCFILRHHLMLWKIFTPRWLYQIVICVTIMIFGCLKYIKGDDSHKVLDNVSSKSLPS